MYCHDNWFKLAQQATIIGEMNQLVHVKRIPMRQNRKTREFLPRFLTKNDDYLIMRGIEEFENTLDDLEGDSSKESFIGQFDDYKLGLCLYETMSATFYPFSKINTEIALELGEYRIKLWNLVNKEYNGVITDQISRDKVLEKFRTILPPSFHNWDKKALNEWLFANYSHRQKRVRPVESLTPEIVRKAVNIQIIKGILRYAQEVEIFVPSSYNLTSTQVKWLFFLSKRFGIYTTINKTKDCLNVKIIGPEELIGRREKYGRKIQALIEQLFKRRIQESAIKNWHLRVSVPWGQKSRMISFDLANLPEFPPINGKATECMDFDSKTEERFFHSLKALTPWTVAREPVVLVENNQVFLPDFSLQFADLALVYIEVVGFWTEDYKAKKILKLTKLAKTASFPLLLVVDAALDFPPIPPFPVFKYKSDFSSILVPLHQYLRETYLVPYEKNRMTYLIENISTEIADLLTQAEMEGILPELTLLNNLGILETENLRYILAGEPQKIYLKKKGWKFIPKIGLIKVKVVKNWRKQIYQHFSVEKQSRIDIKDLLPIFPKGLPEGLVPRILEYFGFKVQWQQLHTITVVRPSKERHK